MTQQTKSISFAGWRAYVWLAAAQRSLAIAIVLLASLWAAPVVAQNYPSKAVRLIVPYPPGGCTGSRRRGWCWGGDGAVTPGLWHWTQRWLAIAMVLMASLGATPVVAQNYPSKAVRL